MKKYRSLIANGFILSLVLMFSFSLIVPVFADDDDLSLTGSDDISGIDIPLRDDSDSSASESSDSGELTLDEASLDKAEDEYETNDLLDNATSSGDTPAVEEIFNITEDAGIGEYIFKDICERAGVEGEGADPIYSLYPKCATSPSECASVPGKNNRKPLNCLFLEEPIGGDIGYDLYKVSCKEESGKKSCIYELWYGEYINTDQRGPVQAILSYEPGKETQGPFGLLYNYLGLFYKFMSGIIVSFVILVIIIGGVRMTTSYGNTEQFGKGREMIFKAIIGMALWFLASLILYTINPTFFYF